MTDFKNSLYEDSDLRQVIDEIEAMEDEKVSIRMKAAADAGVIAKRIKAKKKEAKDAAGIPTTILNRLLKQRDLERKLEANANEVEEQLIELFAEASGQFSWLAPSPEEPQKEVPAARAARRAKNRAEAHQAAEQADGERVLAELGA